MKLAAKQIFSRVGLFILAMVTTFLMVIFAVAIIDSLPRPMQGESVRIPKSVCMAFVMFMGVIFPWFVSLTLIEQARTRIYFLFCLSLALLIWCLSLGMIFWIHKAHGRGL